MEYLPPLTKATPAATRPATMPGDAIHTNATPGQHKPQTCTPSLFTPPSPFHSYPRWSTDESVKSYALHEYSGPCTPSYQPLRWTHQSTWASPSGMNAMAGLSADHSMFRSTRHHPSPTPYCYPSLEKLPPILEGLPSITHASSKSDCTPEWTPIHQPQTSSPSPPTLPSSPLSVLVNNESQRSTSHEDFARHSRSQRATQRVIQSGTNYALQGCPPRPSTPARSSPLLTSNRRTASPVKASTSWWQRSSQSPKRGLDDELRRQTENSQPQQQQDTLHPQQNNLAAVLASQLQQCKLPHHATVFGRLEILRQKLERIQSDLEGIKCDQKQLNSRIATETDIIALRTQLLEQMREEIREELRNSVEKETLLMRTNLKEEITLEVRKEIVNVFDVETEEVHSQPTTILDNLEKDTDTTINTEAVDLKVQTDSMAGLVDESTTRHRREMQDLTHGTSISFYLECEELRTKIAKMNNDFSDTLSRINELENTRLGAVETHTKGKFGDLEDMAWPNMTANRERAQESEEDSEEESGED